MSRINSDRLKLELRRARIPALQYFFLIACAVFAMTIMLKNQYFDKPWESKRTYDVQFDDVKGVVPGQQRVRMSGVDVGIITDSKVGKDGLPVLEMKIRDEFGKFYNNAQFRLRPLTPLQDIYVDVLDRGTPAAGELKEGEVLKGGRATAAVDVSRVLNIFDGDTRIHLRTLITQLSQTLDDGGGEQLKQTFVAAAPFLKAAQQTSQVVADRRRQMKRLVHNLAGLTEALSERDRQLTSLVRDGSSTLKEIGANAQPFDATLRQIPPLLSTMRSSFANLRAAEDQLDPALRSLGPVSDKLESGLTALEAFSGDATPALQDLRPAMRSLAPLTRALQPTSRNLRSAVRRLRPQAPQYDTLSALVPKCFQQLQNFFHHTLSVVKFGGEFGPVPRGENFSDATSAPGIPDGQTDQGTKLPTFLSPVKTCTGMATRKVSRSNG